MLVKRALFLLNAAFAMAILDLISQVRLIYMVYMGWHIVIRTSADRPLETMYLIPA